jgi:hypothetical protein
MASPSAHPDQPDPAVFVPANPDAVSAAPETLRPAETGSLDPLIAALARASDRVALAQGPARRPTTAS